MTSAWRALHASLCRMLEGSLGVAAQLRAWEAPPGGASCRNPTPWRVLSLDGSDEPVETGP
jgi:hypothetical protein